jgi:hypothetical protein
MRISSLAVRCRSALIACLGNDRGGDGPGRPIATGRTGVAQRRLIDESVVKGGAMASKAVADREPAQQKFSSGSLDAAFQKASKANAELGTAQALSGGR